MTATLEHAVSADGTVLTHRVLGAGPPLVVAHGAWNTDDDYLAVGEALAADHRVLLLRRRAYNSAPGPRPGSFLQDGEDMVALLATCGTPGIVFGHSAGGLGALHAARLAGPRLAALALYEPPGPLAGPEGADLLAEYRRLRTESGNAAALHHFLTVAAGVPPAVITAMLAAPELAPRLALAEGVERDLEALAAMAPTDWADLRLPVLLIAGADSSVADRAGVDALAAVLRDAEVVTLPGQGHIAHVMAPALLAGVLRGFCARHAPL